MASCFGHNLESSYEPEVVAKVVLPKQKPKKCFGTHGCWQPVERVCKFRNECLLEWGRLNLDMIRKVKPELAKQLEEYLSHERV